MEGVTTVSNTVTSTASTSINVAKKAGSDVIQFQFYKNPVFILFVIYSIFIFGSYSSLSEETKDSYVFSNKFRDKNGTIYWKYLLTYPYDPSKSTGSLIYSIVSPPIVWYLFFFTLFVSSFANINLPDYQSYFYALMFSFLVLIITFTFHMIIFNLILRPSKVDVEIVLGDQTKSIKTYESFYRTQWVLLAFLSPLYVCIAIYIMRKLK
mgnify:FL=1|tara:strand:+ start:120 stop:746 length:627 start_codon:yes stop_codon:yes gene_type:complete